MIRRPGAILALLTGLNLLNYLDRLVVSAVLPKIQEELHISNFVGGLLATVFLLGYFVTSPAFGALGDRMARKGLITLGVLVWSAATMASGVVGGALALLVARAFVGIGEASYATLAPTIIDDVAPPEKKGRALAWFYAATPIGAALGYLVGGFVEKRWGWRSAFFVAGGPGMLLAFACLLIAEPARPEAKERPDVLRDLKTLLRQPLYKKGVLGYCASTAAVGAFSYWAPKFLYARYALPLDKANFQFGVIVVVAGGIATFIGGRLADVARRKLEAARTLDDEELERATVRANLKICAMSGLLGAPFTMLAFLSPSPGLFFLWVFFAILGIFLGTSPINAVILKSVPAALRGSAMALSIFSIHMFGDLWSPPLVGLLADHVPIATAMMSLPIFVVLSGILWWPPRVAPAR